ncbi:MAG: hypothetical protein L3J91_02895 [Thermoplasmata archaeon]|nr:hypothetical protein [Thermoplasmata archaeon]
MAETFGDSALGAPRDDRVRLPREAIDAVEWFDGETIRSVWTTGSEFLVVSTLRCVVLTRGDGVHRPAGWTSGAEYLFFNLAEPKVVGLDEVELAEEFFEGRVARLAFRDPVAVQEALVEARAEGRIAWALRRAADEPGLPVERPTYFDGSPGARRPAPRPTVKTPCRHCGNLFETTGQRCPYCSAPRLSRRSSGPRR